MINALSTEGLMVHLHVHGEFSKMDGLSKSNELVAEAKRLGQTALALTDHGVMGGIPEFIKACQKEGIKPIPGVEAYMTKDRHFKSEEFSAKKEEICIKYRIATKQKGGSYKPKLKAFNTFISAVSRDWSKFDDLALELIKDWLMEEPLEDPEHQISLFDDEALFAMGQEDATELINDVYEAAEEHTLERFKKEILDYLEFDSYHLLLLAVNGQGLKDLYNIVSDSHINGFYSDPRTDFNFIKENGLGKNIIATSACLGGYFAKLIDRNQIDEAKAFIAECKEIFYGFYLEKQATTIPKQIELNEWIDRLALETNTPKIVTTDAHFARAEDWDVHDVLVAASFKKCVGDTDRYIYSKDHYLKSEQEVIELINDEEAILNTKRIADMINVELPKEPLFPKFISDGTETMDELISKKSWNNLMQFLFKNPHLDAQTYSKRLDEELKVIIKQGFSDYFLIEEDMINATKKAGFVVGPGRGSAAGSLVAFVLGITTLDPIKNDLLFERFLNPERAGYPDIDVDYSYAGARWVQMYLKEKYGKDKVAQIGTYGTLAARSVIKRVGKTLGYGIPLQSEFAKTIPDTPGVTLKKAYDQSDKTRAFAAKYPKWWETALSLEGHISSMSVHAGGIVLSPVPIWDVVPLRKDEEGLETTQFDMEWIEKFLVKFDVLKINTLDLIKNTMDLAGISETMDMEDIPLNDPYVYEQVYNKLDLNGIFQCESDLFHKIISDLKPTCFEDIGVIVALGRPGPLDLIPEYVERKWGRSKVTYPFDSLEPILKETYGVWVYQEQLMVASRVLGGLSQGQSDYIRKGVSKKLYDMMNRWVDLMIYGSEQYKVMQAEMVKKYPPGTFTDMKDFKDMQAAGVWVDYDYEKQPYVEGAVARGYDLNVMLKMKKDWIAFGEYCFNKAHSACYAKLSVITAWLKAYYPEEFIAALLSLTVGKKDSDGDNKQIKYMNEAEKMGITILPADINKSEDAWTPNSSEHTLLYGLSSINKVTDADYQMIKAERPFISFEHFLIANDEKMKIKKDKVEMLIKAGAFDSINKNRNKLLREYYKHRGDDYEQISETTTKRHIMDYEREAFGTSVTIKSRWEKIEDGKENVSLTGTVTMFEEWTAKSGKTHGKGVIATNEEPVNFIIWGFKMNQSDNKEKLTISNKVTLKGTKSGEEMVVDSVQLKMGILNGQFIEEKEKELVTV